MNSLAKTAAADLKKQRQRISLTLMLTGFAACVLILAMVLALLVAMIFYKAGWLDTGSGMFTYVWLFAAVSLAAGICLALLVSRVPLRPVNRAIDTMNRLAEGDYSARMNLRPALRRVPLFRDLQESFNTMASELESTEILRSDFINDFSHEFKTPIVSIAGFAKLLKNDGLPEEERREYLDIIETESKRLASLSTRVLELSRIESRAVLANVTEIDLSEQLRVCMLLLENEWTEKNLSIEMDFEEYSVPGDPAILRQVWINLFDNAVKYTPPGGTVSVSIEPGEDSLAVSVTNTGSSIPPEQRGQIFRKFYQGDSSRATPGNGIGLALVKKAVDLHSGTVTVTGTENTVTFTVTLPK